MSKRVIILTGFFLCSSLFTLMAQHRMQVAAATGLKPAMTELIRIFEETSDLQVELTVSNSRALTGQILNDAPFDIFFSDNQSFPEKIFQGGKCFQPAPYVSNQVYLWIKEKSVKSLSEYLNSLPPYSIALVNPDLDPNGRSSIQWLQSIINEKVANQLLFVSDEEELRQYISKGVFKAALMTRLDSRIDSLKIKGRWIPSEPERVFTYYTCILTATKIKMEAEKFKTFLLSGEGQAIFARFGLQPRPKN